MRKGYRVDNNESSYNREKVFTEAMDSLEAIHAKGFCHHDCRLPNILWFPPLLSSLSPSVTLSSSSLSSLPIPTPTPSRLQIIDFGHASKFAKPLCPTDLPEHNPLLPSRIINAIEKKENVLWHPADDVYMLAKACFQFDAKKG